MAALVTEVFKDNIEFNILLNNGDFLRSQEACQELIPPANVASFTSAEEYNFILDAIAQVEDPLQFVWIGLQKRGYAICDGFARSCLWAETRFSR